MLWTGALPEFRAAVRLETVQRRPAPVNHRMVLTVRH